jgi:hypothetical protein
MNLVVRILIGAAFGAAVGVAAVKLAHDGPASSSAITAAATESHDAKLSHDGAVVTYWVDGKGWLSREITNIPPGDLMKMAPRTAEPWADKPVVGEMSRHPVWGADYVYDGKRCLRVTGQQAYERATKDSGVWQHTEAVGYLNALGDAVPGFDKAMREFRSRPENRDAPYVEYKKFAQQWLKEKGIHGDQPE